MTIKHTPGPWTHSTASNGRFEILGPDGHPVLRINGGMTPRNQDAHRIVACVNACEGIETAMLERFPLSQLGECINAGNAMTLKCEELEKQRDELLSELRGLQRAKD